MITDDKPMVGPIWFSPTNGCIEAFVALDILLTSNKRPLNRYAARGFRSEVDAFYPGKLTPVYNIGR